MFVCSIQGMIQHEVKRYGRLKVYIGRRIQIGNGADNIINGQQDGEMRRETSKMHKLFISVDDKVLFNKISI